MRILGDMVAEVQGVCKNQNSSIWYCYHWPGKCMQLWLLQRTPSAWWGGSNGISDDSNCSKILLHMVQLRASPGSLLSMYLMHLIFTTS